MRVQPASSKWLSLSLVLGVGLTLVGMNRTTPGAAEAAKQATKSDNKDKEKGKQKTGPVKKEVPGHTAAGCEGAERRSAAELLAESLGLKAPEVREAGFPIQALFVTIAEPAVSNFGFDQQLDAIMRALEQDGHYDLDRFWLPFKPAQMTSEGEGDKARCPEQHPGVLIFRESPGTGQAAKQGQGRMAVFLIGETPTGGVHQGAFRQALLDAGEILPASWPGDQEIPLVGPTFSGSAQSLRIALDHALVEHPGSRFRVLSGSATNRRNQQILAQPKRISFQATVLPDDVVKREFYCYLRDHLGARTPEQDDRKGDPKELLKELPKELIDVAVLSESTTPYGQDLGLRTTADGPCDLHPRLVLPYPIRISRLRSIWRKDHNDKNDPPESAPRLALPRMAEDPDRTDIPPILSPSGVLRDDLALTNLLTTISHEKIRFVGLFTLDAEDKSFLAQQLHKFCPDVRLFTLESDLLDAHPDDQVNLRGMLVASTYPLFNRNQQWTFPFSGRGTRIQFTSSGAQGVYNATLALLGKQDDMLEYAMPFAPSVGQTRPELLGHPPVWISAIGSTALVPLAVKWPEDHAPGAQGYLFVRNPPRTGGPQGLLLGFQLGVLQLAILLIGAFVILICVGYFYVTCWQPDMDLRYPWRIFIPFRPLPLCDDTAHDKAKRRGEQRWQQVYLLTSFFSLTWIYGFLTHLFFIPERSDLGQLNFAMWRVALRHSGLEGCLGILCCLGLLAVLLHIVFRTFLLILGKSADKPQGRRILWLTVWGGLMASLTVALILLCLWATGWSRGADVVGSDPVSARIFLLNRLGNPGYGLSPAVPLLCLSAALSIWGYSGLRRLSLLAAAGDRQVLDGLWPEKTEERDAVEQVLVSQGAGPRLTLVVVVLCAILLYPVLGQLTTLEGRQFDRVCMALFGLVYGLIIRAFVRFFLLWHHLQRFLRHLAAQPMVDAYDRMPVAFSRTVGIQLLERIPLATEMEALERHFGLLANHFDLFENDIKTSLDATPEVLQRFKEKIAAFRECQKCGKDVKPEFFLSVFGDLNQLLKLFWRRRPLRSALTGKLPVDEGPTLLTTNTATLYMRVLPDEVHLWLRLAEDFIAIHVVTYISHAFPLLRSLLIFVVTGMLLLLFSLNVYPFQPQHLLLSLSWLMILSIVALTLFVFVRMNQDEVLSRIAKSEPGKITWDRFFISPLLLYVVLPLLTLVSSQFPEIRGPILSFIEPFLRALK